jgi:lipopolysaccharide export LptBFGC system permease protein LptF
MGNQQLTRAMIFGGLAAAVLVGLFLLVFFGLEVLGASDSTKLFGALLAPPALLGLVLFILSSRRK